MTALKMTHLQRQRYASTHAAIILEGAIAEGWPYFEEDFDGDDKSADLVRNAIFLIIERLKRDGLTEVEAADLAKQRREKRENGNGL